MAMTLAGIPFEDNKLKGADWGPMKKDRKYQPYGHPTSLPILEVTLFSVYWGFVNLFGFWGDLGVNYWVFGSYWGLWGQGRWE